MSIDISNKKVVHKRQIMTLLDVAGNVGGLNDAMWLLVNFFMVTYSSIMYMRSVAHESPVSMAQK